VLHDELAHIAELARLDPDADTLARFSRQCMDILAYIRVLDEVDTAQVEPLYSPLEQQSLLRPDAVGSARPDRAAVLANAPETDGEFFIVPRIV
jgi:aspartyl-tRNA(Asn)/glutamyl-tRNA(Gln) amidotransferase subunit C